MSQNGMYQARIRPLAAPMFDAKTGKSCEFFDISNGKVYTFGRSKSSCDILFKDIRVSRQHCHIFWDDLEQTLVLLDGISSNSSEKIDPKRSSLNGVYVDGRKVNLGNQYFLNIGSEVSLIVPCVKGGRPQDDGFGDAIGFVVETLKMKEEEKWPNRPSSFGDLAYTQSIQLLGTEFETQHLRRASRNRESLMELSPNINYVVTNDEETTRSFYRHTAKRRKSSDRLNHTNNMNRTGNLSFVGSKTGEEGHPPGSTRKLKCTKRNDKKASSTSICCSFTRSENEDDNTVNRENHFDGKDCTAVNYNVNSISTVVRDNKKLLCRNEPVGQISPPLLYLSKRLRKRIKASLHSQSASLRAAEELIKSSETLRKSFMKSLDYNMVLTSEKIVGANVGTLLVKDVLSSKLAGLSDTGMKKLEDDHFHVNNGNEHYTDTSCSRLTTREPEILISMKTKVEISEVPINNSKLMHNPKSIEEVDSIQDANANLGCSRASCGFFLNRLENIDSVSNSCSVISIQELLTPVDDIKEIFVATFTSDILWFLHSNNLSPNLPVTVACHHYEKSWSSLPVDRYESPYQEWPNLTVVYPPFPKIASIKNRGGIGCHHPKLFLIKRKDTIRVVITSANLNERQWLRVSNTVWWQDFPRLDFGDYSALFSSVETSNAENTVNDFAAQLAAFVACLVADIPQKAHWAIDLAQYDFSNAAVSLVASVPGIHGQRVPSISHSEIEQNYLVHKYLGVVPTTVVGIAQRFHTRVDSKGEQLRALAALLNGIGIDSEGMIEVHLKRAKSVLCDPNAVSVIISKARCSHMTSEETVTETEDIEHIQLGFLPRDTAKWVSPLCDGAICSFKARIWPKQALLVASGQKEIKVRLALYVFQSKQFTNLSRQLDVPDQVTALCCLRRSLQHNYGIWRLEEVLSQHNWPDAAESEFVYCASSVGTSLNSKFLAAFSAATGRRAIPISDSSESDPEWGCWTDKHEARSPSIKLIFPTIDRVKDGKYGPFSYCGLMCFAESTWERLKTSGMLHDAVPYPTERAGFPMHIKIARRRFQDSRSMASFGWLYCGSHNFSPAAWGKPINRRGDTSTNFKESSWLHICNYELGLIFIEPPVSCSDAMKLKACQRETSSRNLDHCKGLDRFVLPFLVPPPAYQPHERPATGKALRDLVKSLVAQVGQDNNMENHLENEVDQGIPVEEHLEIEPDISDNSDVEEEAPPPDAEQDYAQALWSQAES